MKTITVRLTVEQWNALHTTAMGELESLTKQDWESGVAGHLEEAVVAMEKARREVKLRRKRA